jgi:hypothetical protein
MLIPTIFTKATVLREKQTVVLNAFLNLHRTYRYVYTRKQVPGRIKEPIVISLGVEKARLGSP